MTRHIAFIGGGNMAGAIIGGLLKQGTPASAIHVLEPFASTAEHLRAQTGVTVFAQPGDFLQAADLVVWAVKPQVFKEAALPVAPLTRHALHLSVAAGIPSASIARWLGTDRVVRSMPNTPALVGLGVTGLYARPGVSQDDRAWVDGVTATMGKSIWVDDETQLDAVTALSGSGPAYVFYFIEALMSAGQTMGLSAEQSRTLAIETFYGASTLARTSPEAPGVLRERVTSKGGTTYAALTSMNTQNLQQGFIQAVQAAQVRAKELGEEFGAD
jgi:pyrroline-5-carboxylate reductase